LDNKDLIEKLFNLKYEDISVYIDRRQSKIKENILLKKATILI
jgi:hypothetical protein